MKITLVMVMSVDGKSTKWNAPSIYHWTSIEDQKHFFSLINQHNLIIMGSKTYLAAKDIIKLVPDKLRVVLTSKPKQYEKETVAGQLEFISATPKKLINKMEKLGYQQALLVSGAEVSNQFLKVQLVNELWLTIEPHLFGIGHHLLAEKKLDIPMQLLAVKQLNKQGTLLLKYKIV